MAGERRRGGGRSDRIDEETIRKAERIQLRMRALAAAAPGPPLASPRIVAGADAAYRGDRIFAAAVAMTYPGLDPVAAAGVVRRVVFPYVPGLFVFREGPALLRAIRSLAADTDLLLINGHGYAHPRRFGMASHLGFLLKIPSIGVAGTPPPAGPGLGRPRLREREAGGVLPVLEGEETIGMEVCTRGGGRPVHVSAGYRTGLADAVRWAVGTTRDHRFPEPLFQAHRLAGFMARSGR
jgi:deoxyribonuclease V